MKTRRAVLGPAYVDKASAGVTDFNGEWQEFITRTAADELMISAHIFDHAARLRSYEIAADIGRSLAAERPST